MFERKITIPPNKFCLALLALVLSYPLAACKEEEKPGNNTSGVHDDASLAHDTSENKEIANDQKANGDTDKNCAMNWDYDSLHYSGDVSQGNLVPTAESESQGCRAQQAEIRSYDDGVEMDSRNIGESGTTKELRVRKNNMSIKTEDGDGQFGGEWPDNEYARDFLRLLPKPNMPFASLTLDKKEHGIIFKDSVTLEQMRDYTEEVKKRGFTINPEGKYDPSLSFFYYKAKNAEGYRVHITCIGNCVLGLRPPNT
jgi:hypothetical protein